MRYLPPLELVVKLPKGYPEDEAPEVELKDGVGWMEEGWRATLLERMRGGELPFPSFLRMGKWVETDGSLEYVVWMGGECLWMIVDLLQGDGLVDALELKFPLVLRQSASSFILCSSNLPRTSFTNLSFRPQHHPRTFSRQQRPRASRPSCSNTTAGPPPPPSIPKTSTVASASKPRKVVAASASTRVLTCAFPFSLPPSLLLSPRTKLPFHALSRCMYSFCLPCLVSYFTLLITEGLVRSVHCPDTACVRARAAFAKAHPPPAGQGEKVHDLTRPGEVGREELEGIVGDELCKRWEWVSEKVRVESGQFSPSPCAAFRRRKDAEVGCAPHQIPRWRFVRGTSARHRCRGRMMTRS